MRYGLIGVGILVLAGCGSSQPVKTVTVTSSHVASTTTGSWGVAPPTTSTSVDDAQLNAALQFNMAYSKLHDAINRVSNGVNSTHDLAQIGSLYLKEVALRANFDTALANINFPASDRNDVKALLVADTGVEDAERTIGGDEQAGNTSMLRSDNRAVEAALHQFDAALTAVQYDVGDA
jgi:hypothetical protein